jgi:hypothetical protein
MSGLKGQSGRHVLVLSLSGFDPFRKSSKLSFDHLVGGREQATAAR